MKRNDQTSLVEIARDAMRERDFIADFPGAVLREVSLMESQPKGYTQDMRRMLWVSIDNDDSRDLDQLTFAEKDTIYVAVADVSSLVKKGTATDEYAANNTTSVYTPAVVFPMLPEKLSTDLTSLNPNEERVAVIFEGKVLPSGEIGQCLVYMAVVVNHAKLSYNGVAAFLEGKAHLSSKEVEEQLLLQDRLSKKMRQYRIKEGALSFASIEVELVKERGKITGFRERVPNDAHLLIENFMIAANTGITRFLMDHHLPVIKRIVATPKRWDRIALLAKSFGKALPPQPDVKALRDFLQEQEKKSSPESFRDLSLAVIKLIGRGEYVAVFPGERSPGHFDLALHDYAHATAPNRRFADLVMQRILKSFLLKKELPYTKEELISLANRCTQKENDANKVERRMQKSAAALFLADWVGKVFPAVVTGSAEKGTWVRLREPAIEGRLIEGYKGTDVGDHLKVKLLRVDVALGFIDFARVS
jgi:exoribonuclease II